MKASTFWPLALVYALCTWSLVFLCFYFWLIGGSVYLLLLPFLYLAFSLVLVSGIYRYGTSFRRLLSTSVRLRGQAGSFQAKHGLMVMLVGGMLALGVHGNVWRVYHLLRAVIG